ncbi:hypothetical protein A7974_06625 [Staphylococcus pasteuri]|nr:hypothetical protein BJG87_11730 [Staphylococcus pasteuri]RFD67346.1 hypothetical protein A7974_06625 [Staphylococcus pasteuri]
MRLSWILWWCVSSFWLLIILFIVIYSMFNGLTSATSRELMTFIWLLVGLFGIPLLIQLIWLIINVFLQRNH